MRIRRLVVMCVALLFCCLSTLSSAAVSFVCNELPGSNIACNFTFVNDALDDSLPANQRAIEFFVLRGDQEKIVDDSYLGRSFCPDLVPFFGTTENKNTCKGKYKVKEDNVFGGFPERVKAKSVVPFDYPQDKIEQCILLRSRLPKGPYDGFQIFAIYTFQGDLLFTITGFFTDEEATYTAAACKDKWYLDGGDSIDIKSYPRIGNIELPTYSGFALYKVKLAKTIQEGRGVIFFSKRTFAGEAYGSQGNGWEPSIRFYPESLSVSQGCSVTVYPRSRYRKFKVDGQPKTYSGDVATLAGNGPSDAIITAGWVFRAGSWKLDCRPL